MSDTEKIHEVIMRLAMEWGKHPYEINNGDCEDFAYAVQQIIPEVDMFWGDELVDNYDFFTEDHCPQYHAFMYYNGKYYDAEEPYGVYNPAHLPYYERVLRESQRIKDRNNAIYPAPNVDFEFTPEPVFNFVVRSWDV